MAQSSPFMQAVVASMRRLYPEILADKSFDNTGLLLEAPLQPQLPQKSNSVLLTIDLTRAVADEAIQGNHSIVVAYHPIIFRGLKSFTLDDTQQASLLRLASNGISVYSPHTAVDIVPQGMADWLCDIVTGGIEAQASNQPSLVQKVQTTSSTQKPSSSSIQYHDPVYITPPETTYSHPDTLDHKRSVVTPSPASSISAANTSHQPSTLNTSLQPYDNTNTGAGRLITLTKPTPLSAIIHRISNSLDNPKAIQIAIPQNCSSTDQTMIRTIGLCPGSGSSVLRAATNPSPDLILTGEMSHHEALAVIERGGSLITLGHSNSERGYLNAVMRGVLQSEVEKEWLKFRTEKQEKHGLSGTNNTSDPSWDKILNDESVKVVVSKADRDPFGVMILKE